MLNDCQILKKLQWSQCFVRSSQCRYHWCSGQQQQKQQQLCWFGYCICHL